MEYKIGEELVNIITDRKFNEVQENLLERLSGLIDRSKFILLESPTGTGKTLTLYSTALLWLDYHRRTYPEDSFQVIYGSKTHAQLEQAAREFRKGCYSPNVTIYGALEKLCINEQVKEKFNPHENNQHQVCRVACMNYAKIQEKHEF